MPAGPAPMIRRSKSCVNTPLALAACRVGKYDLVLADVTHVLDLRRRCGATASKPAFMPLLYKPTAAELTAAEKEANCLFRPSQKSSDLLTSSMRR